MPISVDAELKQLSQHEFAEISYGVMAEIFALQGILGNLFNEEVYTTALQERLHDIQTEVEIKVSFDHFHKSYFMDVLASAGGVFELKAVEALHQRHRNQLMNYLLLTELKHGKLVNVRAEKVEHEFINATKSLHERQSFSVEGTYWNESDGFGIEEKTLITDIIRDWGTGLERGLYEEALVYFLSVSDSEKSKLDVVVEGRKISTQPAFLCAPNTAIKVTTFENNTDVYQNDLYRFLRNTTIDTIQWINISRNQVCFHTISEK